ncbi:MAG: GNVR domain-containing protein, partial [Acidobacteriota bacterium]
LAELSQELDIDALQKLLDAKQAQFNEYQVKLGDLRLSLKTTEHRLKTLRTEVEAQPQFLVISKAITDDALFNKTDKDGKISEELARLKLQSQEINPVYQTLINELVTTKITYGSLIPQREHLTSEITTIKKETEDLRKDLDNRKLRYATLERARDVGLKNLTASREKGLDALKLTTANELEILKVNRAYGLAQLESARKLGAEELARHRKLLTDELLREKTLAVSSLQREVENKQGTYKLLAQKAEAAQLAKTEQSKDVKLVAAAVKPTSPTKPRPFLNAALAFVFGGVSSCLFVLGRYMLMIS